MKGANLVKLPKKLKSGTCPNCGSEDLANRAGNTNIHRVFGGRKGHHGMMGKICMRCGFRVATA